MASDGREGSSLFKLSGSVHVEPTSGQQRWQPLVSSQRFGRLLGRSCCHSALLHWKLGLPGVLQHGALGRVGR